MNNLLGVSPSKVVSLWDLNICPKSDCIFDFNLSTSIQSWYWRSSSLFGPLEALQANFPHKKEKQMYSPKY